MDDKLGDPQTAHLRRVEAASLASTLHDPDPLLQALVKSHEPPAIPVQSPQFDEKTLPHCSSTERTYRVNFIGDKRRVGVLCMPDVKVDSYVDGILYIYVNGRLSTSYDVESVYRLKDQLRAIHWVKTVPSTVGAKASVQLVWTIEVSGDDSISGTHSEVGLTPAKFSATLLDSPAQ
jgi:hypothetical protein